MKTKETSPFKDFLDKKKISGESTRHQALAWWKQLKSNIQLDYWRNYQKTTFTPSQSPDELTGREIEEIWRKECYDEDGYPKRGITITSKTNQKQFKQFDETLFKSYINKFSNEDKVKALNCLLEDDYVANYAIEELSKSKLK